MSPLETVTIEKLVHGGQGLATLADGRKAFVWNALPGEVVGIRIIKKKRSYVEAIAETVAQPSAERVDPTEANYLATSPWQMMQFAAENTYKQQITAELLAQAHVAHPELGPVIHGEQAWHYRNKMEYSFWGDEAGLHLALHRRGSHGKEIVQGSALAMPAVDVAAQAVLALLQQANLRAGDLKTVIVRVNQAGQAVAAVFVKPEEFPVLPLPAELQGLAVYHSHPKSPASVPTKLLQQAGTITLSDTLLGKPFTYDVLSFFQGNLPVFEQALQMIAAHVSGPTLTDMYAGVGAIGLSVAQQAVQLIELDAASAAMARTNAATSGLTAEVIEASTETVLEYITGDRPVIFDPPRAGLHAKVVSRVLEVLPETVIYLSCNPATQARDLAALQLAYDITELQVFNFFPRTPHIESLAVLKRR